MTTRMRFTTLIESIKEVDMEYKKPWRPDNWEQIKSETTEELGAMGNKAMPNDIFQAGVEAGADAMLKSLRSIGFEVAEGVSVIIPKEVTKCL